MANVKRILSSVVVGLSLLAICATGCMMSPTHQDVYWSTSSRIPFYGFMTQPDEPVVLEAFNYGTWRWEAFAETSTLAREIENHNGTWHYWSVSTTIPRHLWVYTGPRTPGTYGAIVRAVTPGGDVLGSESLFTFESEFDPLDPRPLDEIWAEHGHDRYVHLYASRE
jgi:hypothetical protein